MARKKRGGKEGKGGKRRKIKTNEKKKNELKKRRRRHDFKMQYRPFIDAVHLVLTQSARCNTEGAIPKVQYRPFIDTLDTNLILQKSFAPLEL